MDELSHFLAERGWSILAVRLPGHATTLRDLSRNRWHDWLASIEDGFALLSDTCEGVVTIGLSLGGVLSLLSSSRYPVRGAVAMSTPYAIPPYPKLEILKPILPSTRYLSYMIPVFPKPPPLDYRDSNAAREHVAYSAFSMRAVAESYELIERMRESLPKIKVPVLLLHSKEDLGVPPINAERIYSDIGSRDKHLEWIEKSGHVMTLEPAKQEVFQHVHNFVNRVFRGGE